jgi:hypothetical protein
MPEVPVVDALRNKRAEVAGTLRQLEQQLAQHRTNLAHLDATMRLFDADTQPKERPPSHQQVRKVWFRQGECIRLIYDELRDAKQPVTTRELAERLMQIKGIPGSDGQSRASVQHTLLGSLNRAKQTIARVEIGGVVSWRLI